MVVGIPVVDGHELTKVCVEHLLAVSSNNLKIVIFDNASEVPYDRRWVLENFADYADRINVIRSSKNIGYYAPLWKLHIKYRFENIGLMHNDLIIYEQDWDVRMEQAFTDDEDLALVGLCGSSEIDDRGGRGGGTVCNFRGEQVQVGDTIYRGQDQSAGGKIHGLVPSACLDSLFMMFRRRAIPDLVTATDLWEDLPLAHFYDRIWPVRLIEKGYHVATMGIECDHIGGLTTTGNERFRNDAIAWLDERNLPWRINDDGEGIIAAEANDPRNIPTGNPETELYLVAERRYLGEFRDLKHFIPCRIKENYDYEPIAY